MIFIETELQTNSHWRIIVLIRTLWTSNNPYSATRVNSLVCFGEVLLLLKQYWYNLLVSPVDWSTNYRSCSNFTHSLTGPHSSRAVAPAFHTTRSLARLHEVATGTPCVGPDLADPRSAWSTPGAFPRCRDSMFHGRENYILYCSNIKYNLCSNIFN